jgi:hypothetical protein
VVSLRICTELLQQNPGKILDQRFPNVYIIIPGHFPTHANADTEAQNAPCIESLRTAVVMPRSGGCGLSIRYSRRDPGLDKRDNQQRANPVFATASILI